MNGMEVDVVHGVYDVLVSGGRGPRFVAFAMTSEREVITTGRE